MTAGDDLAVGQDGTVTAGEPGADLVDGEVAAVLSLPVRGARGPVPAAEGGRDDDVGVLDVRVQPLQRSTGRRAPVDVGRLVPGDATQELLGLIEHQRQ